MSKFTSITNFINSNQISLQRSNRFWMNISKPDGSYLDYKLCEVVNLPSSGISAIPYQIDNKPNTYIPYARNYDNNQITVTIRENLINGQTEVLPWFENWLNLIVSKDPTTRKYQISYYNDFLGQATFKALDLDGGSTVTIDFFNVYPNSVKPSSYSYEETNNYNKVEVTLVFEDFKITT